MVYVVRGGSQDCDFIAAVFSDKAKAERYAEIRGGDYYVTRITLDEFDDENLEGGLACFGVYVYKDEAVSAPSDAEPDFEHANDKPGFFRTYDDKVGAHIYVIAKSREDARRVAELKRTEFVKGGAFDKAQI